MRPPLLILACLLTVACINTSVQQLDQTLRPAQPTEAVVVLTEEPDQPYTIIAVIESRSSTLFDSFDDLRREMIAEAANLGGDALIVGSESKKSTPIFNTVGFVMSETKGLSGEVSVFDR